MPRRKSSNLVRNVGTDLRFNSTLLQKFINSIMERGKKNVARAIVYEAMDIINKRLGSNDDAKAYEVFEKAIRQARPAVEVKSRRVGGGVYQIPIEVRPQRSTALAFRWIIGAAKTRPDKTMGRRLAQELLDASAGQGTAMKKKTDVHRMAEANRAFSHYAW